MAPGLSCFPSASQPLPSVPGIAYKNTDFLGFRAIYPLRPTEARQVRAVDKPKVGGERASERLAEATGPEQAAPKSQHRASGGARP